jgi:hypothetical protein
MKVNKIDHICIAVKNLDEARKVWEPILGKTGPDDAYVDEPEKINVARYWVGGVGFELMESTSPDGDVAGFIEKRVRLSPNCKAVDTRSSLIPGVKSPARSGIVNSLSCTRKR